MDTPSISVAGLPALVITPEMHAVLEQGGGQATFVDPQTQAVYSLEQKTPIEITSPELIAKLKEGLDAIDRGDVVEWNSERYERIIAEAAARPRS